MSDLVKRVIGLPGETISDRNGTVYIDGTALAQPWLPKNDPNTYTPSFKPVRIAPNHYFVMGDNRAISCDSRYWGTVHRSLIVGKVEMRIWPISRIDSLPLRSLLAGPGPSSLPSRQCARWTLAARASSGVASTRVGLR